MDAHFWMDAHGRSWTLMDAHGRLDANGRWSDAGWTLDGRWTDAGRTLAGRLRTFEKFGHATVTRRSRSRFRIIRNTVLKKH